jgi:hypothetical protein
MMEEGGDSARKTKMEKGEKVLAKIEGGRRQV